MGPAVVLAALAAGVAVLLLLPGPPPLLRGAPGPRSPAPGGPGPGGPGAGGPGAGGAGGGSARPPRRGRVAAVLGVTAGVTVLVGGPVGATLGLLAAGPVWWLTGRLEPPAVRRRRVRLTTSMPHAVDLMAACLTVGLSPSAALEAVARAVDDPMAEELAAVSARLRLGSDPADVWRELARHPQLGGLGRAVSRAVDSGASVAEAMVRLADDLRLRSRAEVERTARTVGVRAAVPLGVCLLPSFVLIGVVPLVAGSLSVLGLG